MTDDLIYESSDGRVLRASDLTDTASERSPNSAGIPAEARAAFDEGVALAQSGHLDRAIEKFDDASTIAPLWPYPYYQKAFSSLLQGDAETALALYLRVDELEPRGFFTSKQVIETLQGEKAGTYPPELYLYFVSHEWKSGDDEKIGIMQAIREKVPGYAPALQKLAHFEKDPVKRLALIEEGLALEPDPETRGMLLLNKAAILNNRGEAETATGILAEIVLDESAPQTIVALAKVSLRQIRSIG